MTPFSLSEMGQIWVSWHFGGALNFPHYGASLTETGHIWGFLALSGERVGVNGKGVAEAYF